MSELQQLNKKLDALIDYLGLDVEEVEIFDKAGFLHALDEYKERSRKSSISIPIPFEWQYTTIEYKLTKREDK